jgi:Tfp pilus assembly protein PilF
LSIASLTLAVLASHAAFAQSGAPPTPPAAPDATAQHATELFEQGRKLLEQGQNAEACAKFDEAIRLDPTAAGTMLNLGLCNERLGKYKTALFWFRRGQTRAAETNLPDAERAAKDHTAALATKVATVRIGFGQSAVAGTVVKIDDDEIKPDDYVRVEVDPGHHTLTARAPGMLNVKQEFDIAGVGGQTLMIQFVAGDNTVLVDHGGRTRKMIALYTLIAGGGFLIADGFVALHTYNNYCSQFASNGCGKQADLDGNAATANHARSIAQTWGTGLFIAGAAGVAAAAVLYFTAPAPERINQTVFVPTVSPDQVGFALSGHF